MCIRMQFVYKHNREGADTTYNVEGGWARPSRPVKAWQALLR